MIEPGVGRALIALAFFAAVVQLGLLFAYRRRKQRAAAGLPQPTFDPLMPVFMVAATVATGLALLAISLTVTMVH